MAKIRYFFRVHMKKVAHLYQWVRRKLRNASHLKKMTLKSLKKQILCFSLLIQIFLIQV